MRHSLRLGAAVARKGFTDAAVPDHRAKAFSATGANTGIGFEVSRLLPPRRLWAASEAMSGARCLGT